MRQPPVQGYQQRARQDLNPQPSDPQISKRRPWPSTAVHTAWNGRLPCLCASTADRSSPGRLAPSEGAGQCCKAETQASAAAHTWRGTSCLGAQNAGSSAVKWDVGAAPSRALCAARASAGAACRVGDQRRVQPSTRPDARAVLWRSCTARDSLRLGSVWGCVSSRLVDRGSDLPWAW